jgi:hypothetical protein
MFRSNILSPFSGLKSKRRYNPENQYRETLTCVWKSDLFGEHIFLYFQSISAVAIKSRLAQTRKEVSDWNPGRQPSIVNRGYLISYKQLAYTDHHPISSCFITHTQPTVTNFTLRNHMCLYTVRITGDCAGSTTRPFRYERSLRRLPRLLVLAAKPPNVLTLYWCYFSYFENSRKTYLLKGRY